MKKCCIIGGSNGLGLTFLKLIEEKYEEIYVLDIVEPKVKGEKIKYIYFDLFKDDIEKIKNILNESNTFIITAGIGRVTQFEKLNMIEIEKIIKINFTSTIKLIRIYYEKLLREENLNCMVLGSFAGEISSPLFSVYGACKAGINKIIESLNIELEMSGSKNRITNVMPLSFKGSSFNGEETNIKLLEDLANNCLEKMYRKKTKYIPNIELCNEILKKYRENDNEFGKLSYKYKIDNERLSDKKQFKIGYMSGTFDLFHIGHLNIIKKAKEKCDYLVIGIHKDASHKRKHTFISFEERKEIVKNIKYVDEVIEAQLEDMDVFDIVKYDYLFVGSDYKGTERFKKYEEYFKDKGVEILYFPYTQGTSSSQLRAIINEKIYDGEE